MEKIKTGDEMELRDSKKDFRVKIHTPNVAFES